MRSFTLAVIMFIIAGACAQQTYQLVWSDEFNGNSLDTGKWSYEVNCDGGGNNELQCYTANANNVAVRNGTLVLTAVPQNYNGKRFTSGRINTAKAASWKYGRFETRAKLPNGIYTWPAIWMMPRYSVYGGWAASGEIDIMENRGGNNFETQSTLHFGGSWPKNKWEGSGARNMAFDLTKDFHTYTAIWTPDQIEFQVDGQRFHVMSLQRSFNNPGAGSNPYNKNGQPFDQEFFFILNVAVGGGFFGGNANALTDAQARNWASPSMLVDYVRVYQLKDGVAPNPNPTPSPTPTPTPTPTPSGDCNAMWNSLTCRPASADTDIGQIQGSRTWLCNAFPKYCTEITSGKYSKCSPSQQIGYAMTLYYNDYKGEQGDGACNFGGLGKVVSGGSTPTPTPSPTPTPTACPSGQSQCQDALFGSTCFPTSAYECVTTDDNKKRLCPKNTKTCGAACYPPSQYNCVNGWLQRK